MAQELTALWLLRHGQSLGNLANDASRLNPVDRLDIANRDMDVPLSELGGQQAVAVGTWLGQQPAEVRPDVVVSSPYVRAADTARHVIEAAGLDVDLTLDERLREREFGILDLLTHQGIVADHPRRRPAGSVSASSTTGHPVVNEQLATRPDRLSSRAAPSSSRSTRYRVMMLLVIGTQVVGSESRSDRSRSSAATIASRMAGQPSPSPSSELTPNRTP